MTKLQIRLGKLILIAIGVALGAISPSYATNIEVVAQHDSYLITGGVIHYTNYTKDRQEAATCKNCFWKVREICKSWLDTNHGSCPWLRLQCPVDMQLVEIFRANANARPPYISELWYFVGYSCIGEYGPISTIELSSKLSNSWVVGVPELRIKFFPPNDAILWHPIKYQVISNTSFSKAVDVFGTKVTLHANGDLAFECFQTRNPDSCISQKSNLIRFTSFGSKVLLTKSSWNATFDIHGINGIAVEGAGPSFESRTTFNVHPLFTHLLS